METSSQTDRPPVLTDLPDVLIGERVVVRPYRAGDGNALWEAIEESREHLRPWLPWVDHQTTHLDSEAYARRSHARWLLREDLSFGIWRRDNDRFLGGSGLHVRDWTIPAFEIGYWLRASEVGKGYMTETVQLVTRLAFEKLSANRVIIRCDSRNLRSAAVPRRLGFIHEATFRHDSRDTSGALRDTFVFALTADDFADGRDRFTS